MRTALLLLLGLAAPVFAGETVWKWVDENGVTHYSDRPVPGATKVEINVGSRWDSSGAPAPGAEATPSRASGPVYRNVEIQAPANDEVIINTGGQVTVNVRVDPPLQPGHTLYLYMDGQRVEGFPPNTTRFDLADVPRGTHSLAAVIYDDRGTRVQESPGVTFHVRQESIANPPVGPTLRQPGKQPRPRGAANKLRTSQPTYAALNGTSSRIGPGGNKLRSTQPSYADLNGAPAKIDPATNQPVIPQTPPAKKKLTVQRAK